MTHSDSVVKYSHLFPEGVQLTGEHTSFLIHIGRRVPVLVSKVDEQVSWDLQTVQDCAKASNGIARKPTITINSDTTNFI